MSPQILIIVLTLCVAGFLYLLKKPELALALQFIGNFFYLYILYKLGLEPFRLVTGIFFLTLFFSYFFGGILLMKKAGHRFKIGLVDKLFILFFVYCLASALLFTKDLNLVVNSYLIFLPLFIIAPFFCIQFLPSSKIINKFFKFTIAIPALFIIPFLYEASSSIFAKQMRLAPFVFGGEAKITNPIQFGMVFAIPLIILLIKLFERFEVKRLFKYLILLIPFSFFLLRSGSRGALISFIGAILFYILFLTGMNLKKKVGILLLIFIISLAIYNFIPQTTINFYRGVWTDRNIPGTSVYRRVNLLKTSLDNLREYSILGVGAGNFGFNPNYPLGSFPHNIVLETAAELGIVGLILFLPMCFFTLLKSFKFIKKRKLLELRCLMKIALTLFIFAFIESLFSGRIPNQITLFLSMGLILGLTKIKK